MLIYVILIKCKAVDIQLDESSFQPDIYFSRLPCKNPKLLVPSGLPNQFISSLELNRSLQHAPLPHVCALWPSSIMPGCQGQAGHLGPPLLYYHPHTPPLALVEALVSILYQAYVCFISNWRRD